MIEHVDPFIGSAVTDLSVRKDWQNLVVVRNLRSAIPIGLRRTYSAWPRYAATPGPIPLATGFTSSTPKECPPSSTTLRSPQVSPTSSSPVPERSASTTTTSGSRPCWSHSTVSIAPGTGATSTRNRATMPRPSALASIVNSRSNPRARYTATPFRHTRMRDW